MNTYPGIATIYDSLSDLRKLIRFRLAEYFSEQTADPNWEQDFRFDLFSAYFQEFNLSREEKVIIFIALAPHLQSDFFDQAIQQNLPQAGEFPLLGGVRGKNSRGFLPTGETALFLLAGMDFHQRLQTQQYFSNEHFFTKKGILSLEDVPQGEPRMSGRLILSQEYIDLLTTGQISKPKFSMRFPAERLETQMEWDDLVLNSSTLVQIQEIENWITHHHTLMEDWGMGKKLKPGFRVLFYGPPGTGKTLTASLLGKYTKRDVYKVDLSMVVSKYIGETEKNLANLFAKAENKNWILFFDEADALFGKRTNVKDAHDKYANQEVSYLLQRIESYNGLVILASNFKSNMDDAFVRRFQSIIHFPMPNAKERLLIWQKAFPQKVKLAPDVDLAHIAQQYEISGAEIMNVVQFCCLRAISNGRAIIEQKDILLGIKKEFAKEGRIMR